MNYRLMKNGDWRQGFLVHVPVFRDSAIGNFFPADRLVTRVVWFEATEKSSDTWKIPQ